MLDGTGKVLDFQGQGEGQIDGAVEVLAEAVDVVDDVGVFAQGVEGVPVVEGGEVRFDDDVAHLPHLAEEDAFAMADGLHPVAEREFPGLLEVHLDHVALGRRDDDALGHHLSFVLADIGSHHLDGEGGAGSIRVGAGLDRRGTLVAPGGTRPHPFVRNDRLKVRVLETLVRKKRTTSPRRARRVYSGSPFTSRMFPKRPMSA